MPTAISISADDIKLEGRLNDTDSAKAIAAALPIGKAAAIWGREIYFSIPVVADLEPESREVMEKGELAYWLPGQAFCIFFGTTPASQGKEIRAASPVNVIGSIIGDCDNLTQVPDRANILIERR